MRRGAPAAAAALLLAACAQTSFLLPKDGSGFELSGRIAVRYNGESTSGHIAWRHNRASDEMFITSPLGQGIARIVREDGEVTVTTAEPRQYRATDAEDLTERVLGFRVPLRGLADWVRARPSAGPSLASRDAEGRLSELRQSGWTVQYLAYGANGRLPARMRLVYPGLELRLAISEWR